MFELIKKMIIGLLTGIVNGSNHTKWELLSNQKCMTLLNLLANEYSQEFHYYLSAVKLDRCVGSCNTLNDLSSKVYVPNKTEDLNLSMFNMITGRNESKSSCECKCKYNGRKCNSDQWWNNDKCRYKCEKCHVYEKDYIWNPATYSFENGKYLTSIMDDSAIRVIKLLKKKQKQLQ